MSSAATIRSAALAAAFLWTFFLSLQQTVAAAQSGAPRIAGHPIVTRAALRSPAQRFGLQQPRFGGTRYIGTVTTMGGTFGGPSALDYDPDTKQLVLVNYGTWGTNIELVALNGTATVIANVPNYVYDVAYDSATKLVYAGIGCKLDTIDPKTGTMITLAGSSNCGTADGQGSAAQFQHPSGIAVDPTGQTLYVADYDRVRAVTASGLVTTITAAGSIGGGGFSCGYNGSFQGVAFDRADGNLYIADSCPNLIRQVVIASGQVTTVAGQCVKDIFGNCQSLQRDGFGSRALFTGPSAIAYDTSDQHLYIADSGNNQIRVLYKTGQVSTLAGSGHGELLDGVGALASFYEPTGIVVLPNGLAYVADSRNGIIRRVATTGPKPPPPPHGITLSDTQSFGAAPYGLTQAPDGSIWYSESAIGALVRIDPSGKSHEYKLPSQIYPFDLAADSAGNIYFSAGQGFPPYFNTYVMGMRSPNGTITIDNVPSSSQIDDVVLGPDNNAWFAMPNSSALANVTSTGQVTEYAVQAPAFVALGFHSDLWTLGQNFIGEYSTSGVLLKSYAYSLMYGPIARGPLNRMWFGQQQSIGEVLNGTLAIFTLPPAPPPSQFGAWNPMGLATAPDGSLWFTGNASGFICNLTTNGLFTPVEVPAPRSAPMRMIEAADGSIWFTDPGASKIGRWF
jgi:streptogramin lyase